MRKIFPQVLMGLAPAITLGVLCGAYPGYRTYEYVWKNAEFCTTCHVHDYASTGWAESSHGKLTTCHDCHHQPLRAYMMETWIMLTKRPKFPQDLHHTPHVPKNLCEACHLTRPEDQSTITGPLKLDQVTLVPKVDHLKLHHLHLTKKTKLGIPSELKISPNVEPWWVETPRGQAPQAERPIVCMDCHGAPPNRAHHFTAVDQSCLRCHAEVEHRSPLIKRVGCRNCHFSDFVTAEKAVEATLPAVVRPDDSQHSR